MTDFLNLPHLVVSECQDCGDDYRISATGMIEPEACAACGFPEFYG